ncbi:hypothetical protein BDZ94DRAFT_1248615 [Collybia nuda]|uniref:F-box domain-containing protein n=1 Tax=Collybia nuda TaxID=64659 RepID=A0A9P5YCP4_9AGAR|nr:hypothetical protein BDZ94DRAFT_1248615 [Collybia nuda]
MKAKSSTTKCLPSSHLPLPVEILDYVFQYFARDESLPFLRVNRAFYDISVRVLYRHIDGLHLHQSVACLLTLEKGPKPAQFVRSLEIGWEEATPTLNLYQLLHRVLQKLSGLNSLYIELPRLHSPTWILSNCTFSLHSFATSLPCNQELAGFLDLQPSIVELSLRGIHDSHSLPFLQTISSPPEDHCEEPIFPLLPTSLPKLTQFRSIHGRPSTITTVISGRPIKMVSIPLFPSLATETLSALSTSSSSIRRLSIMSFDPAAPEFLLSEVVKRFPNVLILFKGYIKLIILCRSSGDFCQSSFLDY